MRILIVEDEARLAKTVQTLLEKNGYTADLAFDGEAGLDCAMSGIYDLVILDVVLPKHDGFYIVRQMREARMATPVLMLTARISVTDKVTGLDKGADYYLTKPFATEELLACIRALMRRPQKIQEDLLRFGDISLDESGGVLISSADSVQLNKRELELLGLLMKNGGHPVDRETLITKVWGIEDSPESNVVDAYMSFLRKKLSYVGSATQIVSLRRIGYYLKWEEDNT